MHPGPAVRLGRFSDERVECSSAYRTVRFQRPLHAGETSFVTGLWYHATTNSPAPADKLLQVMKERAAEAVHLTATVRGQAEAAKIVPALSGLEFFVTDVDCSDSVLAVCAASDAIAAAVPNVGVVLLSAGPKRLIVHARVPPARANFVGCAVRLVAEALADIPHVVEEGATDMATTASVYADPDTGRDPFADKDAARMAVADYMQEQGLFGDSDDGDDDA